MGKPGVGAPGGTIKYGGPGGNPEGCCINGIGIAPETAGENMGFDAAFPNTVLGAESCAAGTAGDRNIPGYIPWPDKAPTGEAKDTGTPEAVNSTRG
jgi:hypothetical protein